MVLEREEFFCTRFPPEGLVPARWVSTFYMSEGDLLLAILDAAAKLGCDRRFTRTGGTCECVFTGYSMQEVKGRADCDLDAAVKAFLQLPEDLWS